MFADAARPMGAASTADKMLLIVSSDSSLIHQFNSGNVKTFSTLLIQKWQISVRLYWFGAALGMMTKKMQSCGRVKIVSLKFIKFIIVINPPHDDVIKWRHFRRYRPRTKASDAELWCFFFDLRLNKRLSKRWRGWWFETPSPPLWCHCNDVPVPYIYGTRTWSSLCLLMSRGTFCWHGSTLIPTWISDYIHTKCGVKLLIYSQNSMVKRLKVVN